MKDPVFNEAARERARGGGGERHKIMDLEEA